jgi:leader peptidase (prepilin peptidase) / N-methyltransferase
MFYWLVVIFILGTAVGSFLNVVVDRTTRRESILGRSYCDHCRATLSTFDLIPIISFVGLGARCRYCRRPISWQYPAVEAVTGFLFVLSFYVLSYGGEFEIIRLIFYFFLVSILVVVAVVDFKFSLIPTSLVFLASLVALFFNYFFLSSSLFIEHVFAAFGAAIFFLMIPILTRGRGMGEGDIILGFLIGMVLGFVQTILAVFLAFFLGALAAIFLIFLGKKRFGQTIPFGPFLVSGFLLALFWSKPIIDWYLVLYLK